MIVLINSASASAAEIVAGALQDDHRGTVMGTRSFGKGSVQTIIPIEGHGALRLTTALYYTPSGRSIQGHGITPDIVVTLPKSEQVANAVLSHESDLYGALKNTGSLNGRLGAANAAPGRSGRGGRASDQAADHRDRQRRPARSGGRLPAARGPRRGRGPPRLSAARPRPQRGGAGRGKRRISE